MSDEGWGAYNTIAGNIRQRFLLSPKVTTKKAENGPVVIKSALKKPSMQVLTQLVEHIDHVTYPYSTRNLSTEPTLGILAPAVFSETKPPNPKRQYSVLS